MYEFDTPAPVRLRIEIHSGDVTIEATATDTTTVLLEEGHGNGASELVEQTIVEQRGDDIIVEAPRRSSTFFGRTPSMDVVVRVPHDSTVDVRVNSGDLQTTGRFAAAKVKSGSGDVQIGIAEGVPAWLDVHSLTGSVSSALGASEPPAEGEPSVSVHANTVTGDISLFRA